MDNKEIVDSLLKLAKIALAEEDNKEEKKEEEKEEVEETKDEYEKLIEDYEEGNVSDVLDELGHMKPFKAIYNALQISKSLSDEAAKSSFLRLIEKRIKKS